MLKKYTLWRMPGLPTLVCAFVCVCLCVCVCCVYVCAYADQQLRGRKRGWDLEKQQNQESLG